MGASIFLSETSSHCPKNQPQKQTLELANVHDPRCRVDASKKHSGTLDNSRKPTQKTEINSVNERANHGQNRVKTVASDAACVRCQTTGRVRCENCLSGTLLFHHRTL